MEDIAIKVENLTKIYKLYDKPTDRMKEALSLTKKKYSKDYYALKDVSFEIKRGETVGIVGTNGSGKSTLLKIITGVLTQSSGTVEVKGKISALLELGAGFNPEYTGLENIYLNGTMMGYAKEEMDKRVKPIVDFADIGGFINQPVKTYSSGMFARLAFAVAINVDPDILIVDEVLAVGDVKFQTKCLDKMEELKSKGTTVLFVSHSIDQIKRFCDTAIWIEKGVKKSFGDVSAVTDLYEFSILGGKKILETNVEKNKGENICSEYYDSNYKNDTLGSINNFTINKKVFKTFDRFEVIVEYNIFEKIDNILIGVAIFTSDDRNYIFGPNTFLDSVEISNRIGANKIKFVIPKLILLSGTYTVDIGLFNNKGLVCMDYKQDCLTFRVTNKYFSEGLVYIEHLWEI